MKEQKNYIAWRDIVLINGEYFTEEHEVDFDDEKLAKADIPKDENSILSLIEEIIGDEPVYNLERFFETVAKKHKLKEDSEIKTYMCDNIDLPDEICKRWDIAWLGGYINQFNI